MSEGSPTRGAIINNNTKMIFDLGIFIVWLSELAVFALLDNQRSIANKLVNWSALITSVVITYIWGGIWWLLVPIIAIPIIAGALGGLVKGLALSKKNNRDKKPQQ